jgi:ERCC4-type nuclease
LIEGDLRYYKAFKGLPDKKALLSAMTSISYFKGFSLFRTLSLEETAEWILHFALKLAKEGPTALPFYNAANTNTTEYAEVVSKRIKKDNITPDNIGEIMLAQIPNVSSASAAAIMQKFSTMAVLLSTLQNDPTCLNAITTTNKTGQLKKLTKPCINAIYDFLVKKTIINVAI